MRMYGSDSVSHKLIQQMLDGVPLGGSKLPCADHDSRDRPVGSGKRISSTAMA